MAYEPTVTGARPWFAAKLRNAVAADDVIEGFVTAGESTVAGGTIQEVLEAIADLADPGA